MKPKVTTAALMLTSRRGYQFAGIALALLLSAASALAAPKWHYEVEQLTALFNPQAALAGMKNQLQYFRLIFTALGYGAVMISVIRKVTKARGGEESMGWVASLVMTVALMATGSGIGSEIFEACDEAAIRSGYSQTDSIKTCWNALLVILPSDSPVQEVLSDASPKKNLGKGAPVEKQDASWTKLAWTWMKMAWSSMTNTLDTIGASLRAVANQIFVMVLLFIPAVALLVGMILIQLGSFLRELLHQSMDVFLPMMIAMLSFAPMRGAASTFIIKYISVAFWPLAWALGNALACSLLVSVIGWAVKLSESTLKALHTAGATEAAFPTDLSTAGYLSGAAVAMPWGLLQVVVLVITLTSLLIIASAIAAPLALTATMTKGACFATAQLREAASAATALAGAVSTSGASVALAPAAASSGIGLFSSIAMRASSSMGSAAARLGPMGSAGGPGGVVASMGASILGSASRAIGSMASASSAAEAHGGADSPSLALPAPRTSMMNTMMSAVPLTVGGGVTPEMQKSKTSAAAAIPRNYRRAASALES